MKQIHATILLLMCLTTVLFSQINWTSRTSGTTIGFYGVTYGNNQYVVVSTTGTIHTSLDGITWTTRPSGTGMGLYGVTFGNNQYVAAGQSGTIITSPDGITWTSRTSGTTYELRGVAYGNNLYVAVGSSGTIRTSPDGITWTSRISGTTNVLRGITYGNNQYVAVGQLGIIRTSPDGITWTSRTSGTTNILYGVTYGNNQYVAVGNIGTAITSPDGITWTSRTSGTTNILYGVTYGNNQYVAAGTGGAIITSPDGSSWISRTSGTTGDLISIAYGNNQFVAAGSGGTILTSYGHRLSFAFASDNIVRQAGIDNDDYVKLAFSPAFTTTPTVNAATIDTLFRLTRNHSWFSGFGSITSAVWNITKDTVIISLNVTGGSPTIAAGDTVSYQGTKVVLSGSFDPLPKLSSALASDSLLDIDGIDKDDYVRITFDTAFVAVPSLTASIINTLFPLNNGHTWLSGSGLLTGVVWNVAKKPAVTITLDTAGGLPTVAVGDTISYNGSKVVITGSFTSPVKLVSAVATDNTVIKTGIDADDYVLLSFSKSFTVTPTITAATINTTFQLNKSHSWLSGFGNMGTKQWNQTLNKLIVYFDTLVSVPTIAAGDTITYNNVKVPVTGSFSPTGITTTPKTDYQSYSVIGKSMQIYTLQGKLISQKKIESENYLNSKSALYNNLSKGMYIVRIPNSTISKRILVE